jgi:hypothetical protein
MPLLHDGTVTCFCGQPVKVDGSGTNLAHVDPELDELHQARVRSSDMPDYLQIGERVDAMFAGWLAATKGGDHARSSDSV